jgi:hypothetical protein
MGHTTSGLRFANHHSNNRCLGLYRVAVCSKGQSLPNSIKGCLMPAHLHSSGNVRQSLGAGVGQTSREETADDTAVSQRSR